MTSPGAGRSLSSTAVVVSDLVGSTALATRIGEDAFERVLQAHDDLAAEVVAAHRGRIAKYLGDGFVAAFVAAGDALACAEALQQSMTLISAAAGEPVEARIGVSLGDVLETDGDLHGRPMTEAARLCAYAGNGTIWCTDIAARSATGRPESDFGPTTTLSTLKGLPPLDARELVWDRDATIEWTGLTIDVLGPLRVTRSGAAVDLGGPKERRVLAILTAHRGAPVTLDAIVDGLWGDHPPRTATRSVHAYIARLRRSLEPPRRHGAAPRVLVTEGRAYRLVLGPDALDAARFARFVEEGRRLLANGRATEAEAVLRNALDAWRGVPYEADLDAEPCAAESRHLVELHGLAREEHIAARLALDAAGDAVPEIEALLADEPLRERAWEFLMLALFRAGRQGDALRAYQRARGVLAEELGVEPGPALRHLEAAILAHDESLLESKPGRAAPHRGLPASLDPGTTTLAGRDDELTSLRAAWDQTLAGRGGFVAIGGPAGSGKTRLVAALAVEVHASGGIVLYAASDPADGGPRTLLRRALRSGGIESTDLDEDFDHRPGETVARLLPEWSHDVPVLLVLEALHDADAATVAAVADIAEWSATLCLLVIGTFRSDEATDEAHGSVGTGQIVLGPLPRDAVGAIALRYADDWTVDQVEALARASGGLPILIHRLAAERAREAGRQRVDAAAARAAAARRRLTATRDDLADGVAELQRLLERRRAELTLSTVDGPERELPPYRGLESFAIGDADDYFGREHLVAELVACVATWPLVAVIGPSGSGKSSLARAGLVSAIASGVLAGSDTWAVAIVVPGARPLAALDDALAGGRPRLLVVDPLEEVWTACTDAAEREAFIDRILDLAADPECTVVACLRSDFVGPVAEHPALAAAVGAGTLLVSEMTEDELRRAVEGPANRRGLKVEPALVRAAIADVAGRPGALPLLSTALLATWERRSGSELTVRDYHDAGGVASALAGLADACYAALDPEARGAARRILLRLAAERERTDVRVRARITDLVADSSSRAAFEALVGRRLVIVDGDEAELTHEALLREWPRLVAWLDEDRAGRRLQQRVSEATRAWREAHDDASELYRGTRLQAALEWAELHPGDLTADERDFLDASSAAAAAEFADAQARATREARRNRRLRVAVSGLAILLVVAIVSAGFALRERSRARRSTAHAERQAAISDASRLAGESRAAAAQQPTVALLLAAQAHHLHPSADTEAALEAALVAAPGTLDRVVRLDESSRYGSVSPDAHWIAATGAEDTLRIVDVPTGRVVHEVRTGTRAPLAPVFSGDAQRVAIGSGAGTVTVWDVASGRRVGDPIEVPGGGPAYGLFAPDDRDHLYLGGHDGTVSVATLGSTAPPVPLFQADASLDPNLPLVVLASADGRRLAVGDPSTPRSTAVFEVPTNRVVAVVQGSPGGFDATGETVVTTDRQAVHRWDASTGALLDTVGGIDAPGPVASPSPDGRFVAVSERTTDRVRVLDVAAGTDAIPPIALGWSDPLVRFLPDGRIYIVGGTGVAIARIDPLTVAPFARVLGGHDRGVGPTFDRDGEHVITVDGFDGPTRVWSRDPRVEPETVPDPDGTGESFVLPSPDLRHVATVTRDGIVRLADRDGGHQIDLPHDGDDPTPEAFGWSPDGSRFVQVRDAVAVVLRVRDGRPPRVVSRLGMPGGLSSPSGATSVEFSRDNRRLVVARRFGPGVTVFDLQRSALPVELRLPSLTVYGTAVSPDGHDLAVALGPALGGESSIAVYDAGSGRLRKQVDVPFQPNGITYARGGRRLVTLGLGPTSSTDAGATSLRFWDARALRPLGAPVTMPGTAFALSADRSGTRLVNGSDSTYAVVWDTAPSRWYALACRLAGRSLDREEWRRYLPGRTYTPACRG